MTNEISTAKCPSCGCAATNEVIQENCKRAPSPPAKPVDLLAKCISPDVLREYLASGMGSDPCQDCIHNEIIVEPGSYIETKSVGKNCWNEIHKCPNCSAVYEVSPQ